MSKKYIDDDGTKHWRDSDGELHRTNGPAKIEPDGKKSWYLHGKRHRANGPATEWPDGTKEWYKHGELVFVQENDGTKFWWKDKACHRLDGPAFISKNGQEEWYVDGEKVDIGELVARLNINPDYTKWTDEEKICVRLSF